MGAGERSKKHPHRRAKLGQPVTREQLSVILYQVSSIKYPVNTVRAVRKPNSVSVSGYPETTDDHSSVDTGCPVPLATYPEARTGRSQTLLYLVLHRVGFTKLLRSPGGLVRSYRTFSPLPCTVVQGGILSVALSFTLPRLHVMEHPALRCSDFPPDRKMIQRSSGLL